MLDTTCDLVRVERLRCDSDVHICTRTYICQNNKNTSFPFTLFSCAILVGFNSFTDRLALIPVALVSPAIWPNFDTIALWFTFVPLAIVYLSIWELALARKEARFFPLALKDSAVWKYFDSVAPGFAFDPSSIESGPVR